MIRREIRITYEPKRVSVAKRDWPAVHCVVKGKAKKWKMVVASKVVNMGKELRIR